MITFAGIDLGGTKCEAQLFDANWQLLDRKRVATPETYHALVTTVSEQVKWILQCAGRSLPVGIGAAGLLDANGRAFTANLPAKNQPLPADIARAAAYPVTYINDCRAMALSEAIFGAGRGFRTVMSLIIGTGVGGGVVIDGHLRSGPSRCGGEFGHLAVGAAALHSHGLALYTCGCGRKGCVETYVSGPGLSAMAYEITGHKMTAHDIGQMKDQAGSAQDIWHIWVDITTDLLLSLIQTIDPDIIVLGGGLSNISGVTDDLSFRLKDKQLCGFGLPAIVTALGGDSSGARGAALAAAQESGYV